MGCNGQLCMFFTFIHERYVFSTQGFIISLLILLVVIELTYYQSCQNILKLKNLNKKCSQIPDVSKEENLG